MTDKTLIRIAKVVSVVCSPFPLVFWVVACMLVYNYLQLLSWGYRMPLMAYAVLLALVFFFTVFVPCASIFLFRKLTARSRWQMGGRRARYIPYVITLSSYWLCALLMRNMHVPVYLNGVLMSAFAVLVVCALVNMRWKISVHMAGIGGLMGFLVMFGRVFDIDPLWSICILLLVAGVLGTSRMLLCRHSLSQIIVGFLVGLLCTLCFVMI